MASRGRYRRSGSYSRPSYGSEAAKRHIAEARQFTHEMGGHDKDVKDYFFGLSPSQLDTILTAYGSEYGASPEAYARQAFHDWKAGRKKMSGLVAKRLFEFLPPRMPEGKKYELAENVWKHFGPTSTTHYTVGPDADLQVLIAKVTATLDETVTSYGTPENVSNRFNWLAAGDVQVKERLLNHFRQMDKRLATERLTLEIPVLQRQVRENPDTTGLARSTITIHKHNLHIIVDRRLGDEIRTGPPPPLPRSTSSAGSYGWVIWVIGAVLLLGLIAS